MTDLKKTLAVILTVIAILPLGASVTKGIGGLQSASTEHFDIIYQPSSIQTAALLYENVEDIYASLVEFFGMDPKLHLPVVVTSEYRVLNAYFTTQYTNRIVMFDTIPEPGQLSTFPQTILYVFRHELTHAFQFNIRGPFMNAVSKVFGDYLSLAPFLYMYPSLSEGGAVLAESTDGYGRLNDSYSMQIVKQAKIEGLFPTWLEVAGSRDTYPSGLLYYNFAGAFLEYLAITYGYDKVMSFYTDFAKLGWSTFSKIKNTFGVPVKQLWQEFYDWIEIPSDVKSAGEVEARTQKGSCYSFIIAPDGSIYCYDFSSWDVLKFSPDLSSCKAILTMPTDEQNLSLSADGTRLLTSYITESTAQLRLYSLKDNSASLIKKIKCAGDYQDYRKGCFVTLDGKEYILAYSNAGQNTYLDLLDPDTFEPVEGKTLYLGYGVIASDLQAFGEGKASMIFCADSHDYVAILSLSDMTLKLVENPDDISILNLTAGNNGSSQVLSFTWCPADAKSTNLSRYGEIEISDASASIRLSDVDVSGGVGSPIRINDLVLFHTRYFETISLSKMSVADLSLGEASTVGYSCLPEAPAPDTTSLVEASGRYRAIKYFKDGNLLPYASYTFGATQGMAIGLTWTTQDPTETYMHQIAAGTTLTTVLGSYTFTSSSFIPYSISLSALYGTSWADKSPDLPVRSGDLLLSGGLNVSKSFELAHENNKIEIVDNFKFIGLLNASRNFNYGYSNYLSVKYVYSRQTGRGLYNTFGYSLTGYLSDLRPGAKFAMVFPRLMWWRCDGPNVTNLPFSFSVDALYQPDSGSFNLTGDVTMTLYSREIQRAFPFVLLGFHVQRFTVTVDYQPSYITGINAFSQRLSLKAVFSFSPVFGEYLTKVKLLLGGEVWTDFNEWGGTVAFDMSM